MVKVEEVSGIGEFIRRERKKDGSDEIKDVLYLTPKEKVFLVDNKKTLEVRTDKTLGKVLAEKYESVMQSRYFGRGGIEIVLSGQLEDEELQDLVRLSYNLTEKMDDE